LAVKGFHFRNQATRMTLKRFLSIKRPVSTWKRIFLFRYLYYWPFSRLYSIWAYRAEHFWLNST